MALSDLIFDPVGVRSGLAMQCLAAPTFGAYYVTKATDAVKNPVIPAHIREVPWYWDEDTDFVVALNKEKVVQIPVEAVCAALGIECDIAIRLIDGDARGKGLASGYQLVGAYTFMKGFAGAILFTQQDAIEIANSTENFVRKEFNAKTTQR